MDHPEYHATTLDGQHHQLDVSVVDQHPTADADIARQIIVRDGDVARPLLPLGRERHISPRCHDDRGIESADPDTRALQVSEDGDGLAQAVGHLTHERDGRRMLLVRTVREVDAHHIEPALDQRGQRIGVARGRTKGRDDLRVGH